MSARNRLIAVLAAGVSLVQPWAMAHDVGAGEEQLIPVQLQKLPDVPGKQVVMAVVSYEPGQASSPHLHSGSVFAYVLEGEVVSQLEGQPAVTYKAGQSWYEPPRMAHLAINLKGPYFLLQALLPVLANPASVVLNTSINAHIGMPNSSVYAASKAGLISLARTLSGELISRGVRVNAVSPGPVSTPLYGKLGLSAEELQKIAAGILGQIPAGRFGEPVEIAKAVVFLASDESAFTVGSELIIDGGMSTL